MGPAEESGRQCLAAAVLFAPSSSSQQPCSRQPGAWQPPRGLPKAASGRQPACWAPVPAAAPQEPACAGPWPCRRGGAPGDKVRAEVSRGRRVWERTLLVAVPSSI